MSPYALASCMRCNEELYRENSLKSVMHLDGIVFVLRCPACGLTQRQMVPNARLRELIAGRAKRVDERKREIGKLVKGFAVDLEVVDTVEDIEMFWDYQSRVSPESIVKEV